MKLVILGAGIVNETISDSVSIPRCLSPVGDGNKALDIVIQSANSGGISEIAFVGGSNITQVMSCYPKLCYFFAKDSDAKGNLHTLRSAFSFINTDTLVIYGDVIFHSTLFKLFESSYSGITFVYDSLWTTRYEGRSKSLQAEAEKVFKLDRGYFFSRNDQSLELLGEFAGIIIFHGDVLNVLAEVIDELTDRFEHATVLDVLNHPRLNRLLTSVDIKGQWAEVDSNQDLNAFRFGTKADTLKNMSGRLSKFSILPQFSFTVTDWESNEFNILQRISTDFGEERSIVVRSSALSEDKNNASMAGSFKSILGVDPSDMTLVKQAITQVIECYFEKDGCLQEENQVFVQRYLEDVDVAGVAFTRDMESKAPYYIINYDQSTRRTDAVTSGGGDKLLTYVVNKFMHSTGLQWLDLLLDALKEIETITGNDFVDVEFAIRDREIFLLQVRPIAAHKNELRVADGDFVQVIKSIKDYIKLNSNVPQIGLCGNRTAYGVMPDWNPAEIIGVSPKPLALSLYKRLITDDVWPASRASLGYRDVRSNLGMVSFGGRPYIDLRVSFNTFTPNDIEEELASRLNDYYINYLEKKRHLHDKVEFDVAITCYSFDVVRLSAHLEGGGFTSSERSRIIESFRKFTWNILKGGNESIQQMMQGLDALAAFNKRINSDEMSSFAKIHHLVSYCRSHGTFFFSQLARFAFIATNLMRSLVSISALSEDRLHEFMKSVSTIPKMLIQDLGKMDFKSLIDKYGHLRPGTYDIESMSYKEQHGIFGKEKQKNNDGNVNYDFYWTQDELVKIQESLDSAQFKITISEFTQFIRSSIEAREFSKFIFTKTVSTILDECVLVGTRLHLQREDVSFLRIDDFLNVHGMNESFNLENEWRNIVAYNKKNFLMSHSLKLPSLIFSERDVDFHLHESDEPNFITNQKCVSEIIELGMHKGSLEEIAGKIVVIEKADPGFDWIFTHNIAGLITKYGGIASHMSIRCAELCIPAGIGCGEQIYQYVCQSSVIELDCSCRTITRVNL